MDSWEVFVLLYQEYQELGVTNSYIRLKWGDKSVSQWFMFPLDSGYLLPWSDRP